MRYRRRRAAAAATAAAAAAAASKRVIPLIGAEIDIFKIVAAGATPEQWAEWLRVPLEHAAATGNHGLFASLEKAGAKCSASWAGCAGRTLLDAAALGGNEDVMSAVLQNSSRSAANVLDTSSKRSALYTAVVGGHEAAARKLILAGADANYVDPNDGYPPIVAAVCSGSGVMVTHLLMAGASPSEYEETGPREYAREALERRFTLWQIAATNGYDEVVSALKEKTTVDVSVPDWYGYTPLMRASEEGYLATVMALLAAGADVDVSRSEGGRRYANSALEIALDGEQTEIAKALIRHGADVNACGGNNWTALHRASIGIEESSRIIDMLLDAGADIAAKTDSGRTPLHVAVEHKASEATLALMRRGASVHEQDADGKTALHSAQTAQVSRALLQHGARVDATDSDGNTALHLAVDRDEVETALALLQHGARVNATNNDGNTALHVACRGLKSHVKVTVDFLLRWGLSEVAVNNASQTPLQILDTILQDKTPGGRSRRQRGERGVRVRFLLERAPADRTWRRRCLLVMLRARNEKKRIPPVNPGSSKDVLESDKERCDRALAEENVGDGSGKEGSTGDGTGVCSRDGETEGGGEPIGYVEVLPVVAVDDALRDTVRVVIEIMPGAVFHQIVMYL